MHRQTGFVETENLQAVPVPRKKTGSTMKRRKRKRKTAERETKRGNLKGHIHRCMHLLCDVRRNYCFFPTEKLNNRELLREAGGVFKLVLSLFTQVQNKVILKKKHPNTLIYKQMTMTMITKNKSRLFTLSTWS